MQVLTRAEDLQLQVDEHLLQVQTLHASAYQQPFRERVDSWQQLLQQLTTLLNEWTRVTRY